MVPASRFLKNDRVEFDLDARTVHGILVEEGESPKVIADGGRLKFTVPFTRLRFSTKSLRKDPPCAMDAWQVVNFREFREISSETNAYSATITHDGKPTISASNAGYGAPDKLAPISGDYGVILDFKDSVRTWLGDLGVGVGEIADEESFWIAYRTKLAPYGVLAGEAVATHFGASTEAEDESFEQQIPMQM
jgi:hypothetical protein